MGRSQLQILDFGMVSVLFSTFQALCDDSKLCSSSVSYCINSNTHLVYESVLMGPEMIPASCLIDAHRVCYSITFHIWFVTRAAC